MFRRDLTVLAVGAAQKKKKWIERRGAKLHHNGKDALPFAEHPSCALCGVRFRYKQDYQTHKESDLHKGRERWVETMEWYEREGKPRLAKVEADDWEWYRKDVVPRIAAEEGTSEAAVARRMRRASVGLDAKHDAAIDPPSSKAVIREPRDQRWPASPKA